MLIPLSELKSSIELFHREVEIYPIWLCPFKLPAHPGMLTSPSNKDDMFVDVGVYGVPKNERFDAEKTTRRIEEFVRNVSGFQMMYADSYMTRDEFRAMFDHSLYDRWGKLLQNIFLIFPLSFPELEKSWDAEETSQRFMIK